MASLTPILRPLSHARPSIRHLLRPTSSACPQRRHNTTTTTHETTTSSPPVSRIIKPQPTTLPIPSNPSTQRPAVQPSTQENLPYHISRTASNNLPVYYDTKRGGSLKLILIRKIAGDSRALGRDLTRELGLSTEEGWVRVNHLTGGVALKVPQDRPTLQAEVNKFLLDRGF